MKFASKYEYGMKMSNPQKGTKLYIKQLLMINFYLQNLKIFCHRKTIWWFTELIFAITFFVCTGQWSKLFSITLPILVIHPKGCDEATPIFSLQVFVGKWVNIFAWFLLHRTVDDPHQLWKNFLAYQITTKGVAGPRPFFVNHRWYKKIVNIYMVLFASNRQWSNQYLEFCIEKASEFILMTSQWRHKLAEI